MSNKFITLIATGVLTAGLGAILAQAGAPPNPQGLVTAKYFLDIGGGTAVTDLTGNAKFPDSPDMVNYPAYFELNAGGDITVGAPADVYNSYGAQIAGYFYPPATGDYIFYLAADDGSNLYLSTDDTPANKKLIAQEAGWSPVRAFTSIGGGSTVEAKNSSTFTGTQWPTKDTANGGAKIALTKGQIYYIEALVKEGGGGDNLAVAVEDAGGTFNNAQPIPGEYLSPFGVASAPAIIAQPQDRAVYAGGTARFSVGLDIPPAATVTSITWQKNGADIPNSNATTLTLAAVALGDNGAKIKAIVVTSGGTLTSSEATLNVATFSNEFAQGVVKFEAYTDIGGGTAVSDLTGNAKFPDSPDDVGLLAAIDTPNPYGDNYGARVSGFIIPPESASYFFFIRSDDASQLFLSANETPPDPLVEAPICEETGCCAAFMEPTSGDAATTADPIPLIAGTKYAFVALLKEGGGGDFMQVAARKEGDPTAAASLLPLAGSWLGANAKPNLGTPQVTKQPQGLPQHEENKPFQLTVDGIVTPTAYNFPVLVQWQRNGQNIPGATAKTYRVVSASIAGDSGTYRAVLTAPSGQSVNSADAVVTVVPDTFPPKVVGATAFPGTTKVGLMFDEALDAVSAGAAANYKVNGAAVTSAMVRTNVANELTDEKNLVQLTVPAALTADFTVTITGVKDIKGNALTSADAAGKILNLTITDIGSPASEPGGPDPQAPSTVTTWGPGAFDVLTTGSNDYWNNADGFNFVWEKKTNSFDVKVRVVSVSPVNNWTAGAIEVREAPASGDFANGKGWELSRHYFCKVDYGGPGAVPVLDGSGDGADSYEFNGRLAPGDPALRETSNNAPGGSVGWGGTGPGNPSPVPFPDAWIRIARVKTDTSDHLLGYSSSDGVNWSLRQDVDLNDATHAGFLDLNGNPAGAWPDVCYVGLGSTSHTGIGNGNATNNGNVGEFWYSKIGDPYSAFIIYRDYGDYGGVVDGVQISIARTATGVTIDYTGRLQAADAITGPWTDVVGATSPYATPASGPAKYFRSSQ